MANAIRALADPTQIRIYLCRCGKVHIETRRLRLSLTVEELLTRLVTAMANTQTGEGEV